MTTRVLSLIACAGLLLSPVGSAVAGPNEGGTLILHANPTLTFTSDIANYCGMAGLDSCSHAVTSLAWESEKKIVFHAIAAFPPGNSPRLKGISFGIDYDPAKFVMLARGTCADFELPDGTWPASGTGTAQSWTTATQTGLLTECHWFAGYAYSEDEEAPDSTTVELIPHPLHGGTFVDDSFPAEVDTIAEYGKLGLGTAGRLACPTQADESGDDELAATFSFPDSPSEFTSPDLWLGAYYPVADSLYIDPGSDFSFAFWIVLRNGCPDHHIMMNVYTTRAASPPVYTQNLLVTDEPQVVGPFAWDQRGGLALVVLTPGPACGVYNVQPTAPGSDRIYFNRCIVRVEGTMRRQFVLPADASSLKIEAITGSDYCLTPGSLWLFNPDGTPVWSNRDTGAIYTESSIAPNLRGRPWTIAIDGDVRCRGFLVVSFRGDSETGDEWWTPPFAFGPCGSEPMAALAEHQVLTLAGPNAPETWYAPAGVPHPPAYSPASAPGCDADSSAHLLWAGRQWFNFTTGGSTVRDVTITNHSSSPATVEFQDGNSDPETFSVTSGTPLVLPVVPYHLDAVRVAGDSFSVETDAQYAAVGPSPGFGWQLCHWGATIPKDFLFYVPAGLGSVGMEMTVTAKCGDPEHRCYIEGLEYPIYPPVTLTLITPEGVEWPNTTGVSNGGRVSVQVPVGAFGGQIWGGRISSDFGSTPLGISLLFDESLPSVISWLHKQPERFMLPLLAVTGPRMAQRSSPPFSQTWTIIPNWNTYAVKFSVSGTEGTSAWRFPPNGAGSFWVPVACNGELFKERLTPTMWPWYGPLLNGPSSLFYNVPRPTGLTADGNLRVVEDDGPGEPTQIVALLGACYTNDANCQHRLEVAKGRGFDFAASNSICPETLTQAQNAGLHLDTGGSSTWDPPFSWPDYQSYVSCAADREGSFILGGAEEPLGRLRVNTEWLYDLAYKTREVNTRYPMSINEECDPLPARELRDVMEVSSEDEYFRYLGVEKPLCTVAARAVELRERTRPDAATALSVLAGFYHNRAGTLIPQAADRDEVGAQVLTALLLDIDVVGLMARFSTATDSLDEMNPSLWSALPELNTVWKKVIWLRNRREPFFTRFGPEGGSVTECKLNPVIYSCGPFFDVGADEYGTWFAFANLAYSATRTVTIPWSDLRVPSGQVQVDTLGKSLDNSASIQWNAGEGVTFTGAAGGWYVGRAVVHGIPAGLGEGSVSNGGGRIRAYPNPWKNSVSLAIPPDMKGSVDVEIFTVGGRSVVKNSVRRGGAVVSWDGCLADGRKAEAGIYFVSARDETGRTRSCMVVKTE